MHLQHDAEAQRTRALGEEPCICGKGGAPLWLQHASDVGKVQVQRFWSDTGKRETVTPPCIEKEMPA